MLKELNTYRGGHTRDVSCAVWHPVHEELFGSGSQDGSLVYWLVSRPGPQACPLQGHQVCSHCNLSFAARPTPTTDAGSIQQHRSIATGDQDVVSCFLDASG